MAADNNLDFAIRIKAEATQAKAALGEVQAQLKGVEQQAVQSNAAAAVAADQHAASIKGVSAAQTDLAESEDQARARIHAMVEQSLAAVDANARVAASARTVGSNLQVTADANSAYTTSTAKIVAAQDAAMISFGKFTKVARDASVAIETLKAGNLTSAAYEKAVNDLGKAVDAGAITQEEYVAALKLADKAKIEDIAVTEAQTAVNKEAALSSRAQSEIATAASEVLSGNFGRLRRTGAAFANQAGLLSKLMTPLGLGITAAALAIAAFGAAVYSREKDLLAFNKALAATGNFAGTTGLQLQGVAAQVGLATGRYGDATAAVLALAQSGDVLASRLQDMATTAVNMAYLTGESIESITKMLIDLQGDPVAAIAKTTAAMGLLTAAQYNQIVETQEQQGATAAAALAMKDLKEASDSARTKLVSDAGVIIRAWDGFKSTLTDIGHALGSIGAQESIAEQIADQQARIKTIQARSPWDWNGDDASKQRDTADARAKIAALQQQQKVATLYDAGQQLANQAKIAHDKALAEALASQKQGDEGFVAQAAAINKKRYLALVGVVDPAVRDRVNAAYDQQIRDAVKRANEQLPHGGSSASVANAVAAAQLNAGMAAAQSAIKQVQDIYSNGQKTIDAQHKAGLVSDQAYFDAERGMLTVWENDKVAALEKEKVAAQSHLTTQADRIKADQKVADIDQQITQVHADAAAKRQQVDADEQRAIAKTQAAWERLKASLGTPAERAGDQAARRVQSLDAFASKPGVVSDQDYNTYLGRTYGAIGGQTPFGSQLSGPARQLAQVNTLYAQIKAAYDVAYAQQQADEAGNYQKLLEGQKQYNAASEKLAKERSAAIVQIKLEEARQTFQDASDGFGQLSQALAQAYGEDSKQAKAAFRAHQAAALAEAIVSVAQGATKALGQGGILGIVEMGAVIAAGAAQLMAIRNASITGGYATGGAIRGPGSATSDSIVIRASDGEYMQNAAAVDYYGVAFMDAVNNMRLPRQGFATGGLIRPAAYASTPAQMGFQSPSTPAPNAGNLMVAVSPVTVIVHSSGDSGDVKSKQSTDNNGGQILELFLGAVAKDINQGGTVAKAADRRWLLKRKGNSYG